MEGATSPRVLVTGTGGFIGSHLVKALLRHGAIVHGLTRAGSDRSRIADLTDLHLHLCDLRDGEGLRAVVRKVRPAAVFHTAIEGVGPGSDPAEMVATNVLGAHHLITCLRETGVERLVVTGGSSEYGRKDAPIVEDDLPEPTSLYGATKAAATLLFQQAAREHGLPVVVLRLFSVFGPGEPAHRLIPTAIRAALCGEELRLTGPGWRRDFVFVDDVVDACLRALSLDGHHGEVMNVGTGRQTSNEDVVALIDRLTGGGLRVVRGVYPPRPTDARFWVANPAKAWRLLGWKPLHGLEEGLAKTIAHFERELAR